uniref:ATP synthase F0 subunit 8 n=1 Tax=Argyroneta aquatica TaxID=375087 RepID=A0A6G7ITL3_ARGAQ|nr:ATP synthase F0 subunit 8 [Argyroneta aquatica]
MPQLMPLFWVFSSFIVVYLLLMAVLIYDKVEMTQVFSNFDFKGVSEEGIWEW